MHHFQVMVRPQVARIKQRRQELCSNSRQASVRACACLRVTIVAATQIKNMIERMVKSGALPEDKTAEWKRRIEDEEKLNELRTKAEAGYAPAAYALAVRCEGLTLAKLAEGGLVCSAPLRINRRLRCIVRGARAATHASFARVL